MILKLKSRKDLPPEKPVKVVVRRQVTLTPTGRKPQARGEDGGKWEPSPQVISQIEFLAGTGLNQEQICHVVGISVDTLKLREKDGFTEITEALKRGRAKGVAMVSNAFFDEAKKGSFPHGRYYLNNWGGWRDNVTTEISGPDGGPVEFVTNELTDVERGRRIASLLNAAATARAKSTTDTDSGED